MSEYARKRIPSSSCIEIKHMLLKQNSLKPIGPKHINMSYHTGLALEGTHAQDDSTIEKPVAAGCVFDPWLFT